jgi:predicted GNAT superfamily acetyltransferase
MISGYEIALAIPADIPGILALQDANQPERGGILSVRFPHEWIKAAVANEAIVVARRDGKIAGYAVSGELSAQADVPVVHAMLKAYPSAPNSYFYGPICVAESDRGQGLAGALFEAVRARFPGRDSITFIRGDNQVSRRAHAKMGMTEVATFVHGGVEQIVVVDSKRQEMPPRGRGDR